MNTNPITIQTVVNAPLSKVWECWTEPEHITQWAFASNDWEAPSAKNDLQVGGTFTTVMAAKDKSLSFEFAGHYTEITPLRSIEYDLGDKRHVITTFTETPDGVEVVQVFDPENENSRELQESGWQAILNNFKKHTESVTLSSV